MFDALRKVTNPRMRSSAKFLRVIAWTLLIFFGLNMVEYFYYGREFTTLGYIRLFLNVALPLWIFWWFRFV